MLALVAALLFVALNGFFVAAEFALVKVRMAPLLARERKGDKRAAAARTIAARLDRYLGATQFGITVASLGLGWVGEPAVARFFEGAATALTGAPLPQLAHVLLIVLAFGFLTLIHILLGELVPKLVAIQMAERTALLVARPVRVVYAAFRPILWVLEGATRLILRVVGLSADVASHGADSEADVLTVLAETMRRSPAGRERASLVEGVVRFSQRAARHAMVPRVDVASLPIGASGAEAAAFLRQQQFSRVILTKERSLDKVAGYLYVKDFFSDPDAEKSPDLTRLRRDVLFVPETQSALDVMRQMQKEEIPIAVVVDEYGGTSGIVTLEDLLEEIVGEIKDELDEEPARITRVPGPAAAWEVDARATMEELRGLGVSIDDAEAAELVGAAVTARLGRLPRTHDKVTIGGATVEIVAVQKRRVTRVRVWTPEPPATS